MTLFIISVLHSAKTDDKSHTSYFSVSEPGFSTAETTWSPSRIIQQLANISTTKGIAVDDLSDS